MQDKHGRGISVVVACGGQKDSETTYMIYPSLHFTVVGGNDCGRSVKIIWNVPSLSLLKTEQSIPSQQALPEDR